MKQASTCKVSELLTRWVSDLSTRLGRGYFPTRADPVKPQVQACVIMFEQALSTLEEAETGPDPCTPPSVSSIPQLQASASEPSTKYCAASLREASLPASDFTKFPVASKLSQLKSNKAPSVVWRLVAKYWRPPHGDCLKIRIPRK